MIIEYSCPCRYLADGKQGPVSGWIGSSSNNLVSVSLDSIIYDSLLPSSHKQNLKLKCVLLTEGRIWRLKATVTSLASSRFSLGLRKLN